MVGVAIFGVAFFLVQVFDPRKTLEAVHHERCTALHGVPTMFLAELNLPDFRDFDCTSLRTGIMAGTLCPAEIMRRVVADMHIAEMTVCYGECDDADARRHCANITRG